MDDHKTDTRTVHIDASEGEGGGQIVRNTVSLAALLRTPVVIDNIRAKRPRAGLMAQHLAGVRLICHQIFKHTCIVEGDALHSTRLSLQFREISDSQEEELSDTSGRATTITTDIGTAGACSLLVQISLPCLIYRPDIDEVQLLGGTNVPFSPPVDEMRLVLLPLLERLFGVKATLKVVSRGFFPRGGGRVRLAVEKETVQTPLKAFEMTRRGRVSKIEIHGFASRHRFKTEDLWRQQVVEQVIQSLHKHNSSFMKMVDIEVHDAEQIEDNEVSITLVAKTENSRCMFAVTEMLGKGRRRGRQHTRGKNTKRMERRYKGEKQRGARDNDDSKTMDREMLEEFRELAERAVRRLLLEIQPLDDEYNAPCVDNHTQDQLIVFMALAEGTSRIRCGHPLTMHTTSAIDICSRLTGATFTTLPSENGHSCIIECQGIAYTAPL